MAEFAVIFDMDGVLFDTEQLVLGCWQETAGVMKLPGIREVFLRCVGTTRVSTRRILREAYGEDFPMEQFETDVHKRFAARIRAEGIPVKPGVQEILSFLQERKIPVALASSTREEAVLSEVRSVGIDRYFSSIIGGDRIARSKPDPDIFLAAAERLSHAPAQCYVLEDSYNGIRAASAAGMHPLMIPDLLPPTEEMETLAEHIFPALPDVQAFLAGLPEAGIL